DKPLAFEDFDERLELKIAPWDPDSFAGLLAAVVVLPVLLIRLRAGERIADDVLDAHTRRRISRGAGALPSAGASSWTLGVFAEGEFDPGHRAFDREILRACLAPPQLDDVVLAADRIRAAVQHVGRRHAAGEVAVDVDVGRVEDVLDAGHRADRRATLVDRVGRDVRMAVDDAGRHELAGAVDDGG